MLIWIILLRFCVLLAMGIGSSSSEDFQDFSRRIFIDLSLNRAHCYTDGFPRPQLIFSTRPDLLQGDMHPKCRFCGITQTTLPPYVCACIMSNYSRYYATRTVLKRNFFVGNTIEVLPAEEKENRT
ncbi:hypothetical protein DFH29DRAFT_880674 [Suillus ampliporus]|nr:hypothetical protein DFH29DRAFT_880674 [Suillus ampliporus]